MSAVPAMRKAAMLSAYAVATVAATEPGGALEWQSLPTVSVAAGNDTNIRLQPEDATRVASAVLTAGSDIIANDAGFQFRVRPQVRSLRYDHDQELDRNDLFATADIAVFDTRQRWSFGGAYARESALTTEFEGSGFVATDVERAQTSLNTAWRRSVRVHDSVEVALNVANVDYEYAFLSPLVDYGYRLLNASYHRSTTERSAWRFDLSHSLVDSDATGMATTGNTLGATWSHAFSTALRADIGIGVFDVTAAGATGADSSGSSFNFTLDRDWPRWTLSSSGGRELRPDGRGTLVREDVLQLEARRRLTERLSIGTAIRGARVGTEGGAVSYARDYAQTAVTVNWRFAEQWAFQAALLERQQAAATANRATGRVGTLSFNYRGR